MIYLCGLVDWLIYIYGIIDVILDKLHHFIDAYIIYNDLVVFRQQGTVWETSRHGM